MFRKSSQNINIKTLILKLKTSTSNHFWNLDNKAWVETDGLVKNGWVKSSLSSPSGKIAPNLFTLLIISHFKLVHLVLECSGFLNWFIWSILSIPLFILGQLLQLSARRKCIIKLRNMLKPVEQYCWTYFHHSHDLTLKLVHLVIFTLVNVKNIWIVY